MAETQRVVADLDAFDGTPLRYLKLVMSMFLPREPLRQPTCSQKLMRKYGSRRD